MLSCKAIPTRITIQVQYVQMPFRGKLFPEDQCVPKVIASIEKEDQNIPPYSRSHMQERHGLRLERRAQGDLRPERVHRPIDDFLGCFGLKFFRKALDLIWRKHAKIIPVIITAWILARQHT